MRGKYSIRRGSKQRFNKVNIADSQKLIRDVLAEITTICNYEWIYEEEEKRARWRFSFHNNAMMKWLGKSYYTAAGLQGSNWIALNNQRPMSFNGCKWVVMHEVGHAMGMNRGDKPRPANHVMQQTKTITEWHSEEKAWMVKRYGKPKVPPRVPREAMYLFPGDSKKVLVREVL